MTDSLEQIKQRFGIIGSSLLLDRAIRVAVQVAPTDISVLVMGESGVGKEFFPQIIHRYSSRKHNPYIAVNCGAIPEGTIDSELFGHRKGSFTGALADRKGYFEEADGGTIFLDEVGELPMATQARLLRVLETGEYIPVGASVARKTNVRIVAATNVILSEAVNRGRFREDLLFRLNTVPISVPALRDRIEDGPLLFRRFAVDSAERYHMPPVRLSEGAVLILKGYRWPGNIRELRNMAERISILEEERNISAETLRSYLPQEALADIHPVLMGERGKRMEDAGSFANEREILYQVLFDMRKDMNELKSLVHDIMQGSVNIDRTTTAGSGAVMPMSAAMITHEKPVSGSLRPIDKPQEDVDYTIISAPTHATKADEAEILQEEFASTESPSESLRIADLERTLVRKALDRYGSKKKKDVADALGISERTLYRKLKEFGFDD